MVLQKGLVRTETLDASAIAAVEEVNQENSTSVMGKAAWGAAGLALLGGVGLLAGALGGGNRNRSILSVRFTDGRKVLLQTKPVETAALISMAY